MKILLRYTLLFILFIVFTACVNEKNVTEDTYFGGKIINPKSSKVFFYKEGKLIDSATLSNNNKFIFKLDSIKEGVYKFMHGDEFQHIILQPNDSLFLRLNTWDFDESLVYSGKGADRNNFLVNLFLINEKENRLFYKYYSLNDTLFNTKVDSLLKGKKLLLSKYKDEHEGNSELFNTYAEAIIELPLYSKKEMYPRMHKTINKLNNYPTLSSNFYAHRINIKNNQSKLLYFPSYYGYLRNYLYNISYKKHTNNSLNTPIALNYIEEVSNNVKEEVLKNNLLDEAMWNVCLSNDLTNEELKKAESIFFNHCSNSNLSKEFRQILDAKKALPKESKLPEIIIYNKSFNKVRLNDVIKGNNAVIYFWPKKSSQLEYLSKRVKYLEKQYPNTQFIGINSKYPTKNWNACVKKKKFNPKNQFLLDKETQYDWLYIDFSRAIIINKEGVVKNAFTHLNTRNFEKELNKIN